MPASPGDTVRVHYRGTLDDGSEFDCSHERAPLEFTIGDGTLIPGFDAGVTGLEAGESATLRIEAADAYGERIDDLVHRVECSVFDQPPYEGAEIELLAPDDAVLPGRITRVEGDECVVDFNHPLAGQHLTFEMRLEEILPRTEG